jgi:putative addiction module component (TIGR02574 family)
MTRPANQLLDEALRLPDPDRAELAARLIESLDPSTDDDADTLWGEEIRQRLDDLDHGRVATIPWSEAQRMILDDADESTEA